MQDDTLAPLRAPFDGSAGGFCLGGTLRRPYLRRESKFVSLFPVSLILLSLSFGLCCAAGKATAGDWPQWRGPGRDGHSTENVNPAWPAGGPPILWRSLVGTGILAAFVLWEARLTARPGGEPLIDLGLFRSRSFSWGIILAAAGVFGMFGVLFTLPQYLQAILGMDAQGAGLRFLPLIGGLTVGAVTADRLVTPMFPGVSGTRPARSSAGMMTRAAASGDGIPSEFRIAATAARRASMPAGDSARRQSLELLE